MRKKVLLSSGGMDSFLLAHEPELEGADHVFVDIGQRYMPRERSAARYIAAAVGAELHEMQALNMAQFEHARTGIIPFRNAELILCAAQHGDDIYLGVIADEVNSDKSTEFLMAMRSMLNISHRGQYWTEGRSFELLTPFRNVTKTELVARFLSRDGDLDHLLQSVSCYDGGALHCGACPSCFKRWVALTVATGKDAAQLQPWANHPGRWHTRQYWDVTLAGYAERRRCDVIKALDIAGIQ